MRKKTGVLLLIVLILLICTAGAYITIGVHYRTHFLRHTTLNGVDVSDYTAEEAEEQIAKEADTYRLVITGRELSDSEPDQETIPGSDFDYHYVFHGEAQEFLAEQPSFLWLFVYFTGGQALSLDTAAAYDEEKLNSAVSSLKCMQKDQMVEPENAYVDLQPDGTYEIVPETKGTKLDPEKTDEAVHVAVNSARKSLNLEAAECYTPAEVTAEDPALLNERDLKNHYAQMVINYYMSGDVAVTLDSSTFMEWFYLDDEGMPAFDQDAVKAWVDKLADQYDTIGTMEPFETSGGQTVYVEAVTYGWEMDREEETEELYNILMEGKTQGRSPKWLISAYTRGRNDIGNTYVEIDYTNQRMWYYKDGELLVETPVVTGNVNTGNASPEGMYSVFMKERNATLEGEGYSTPVSYWMPFYDNVGIHDADSWRSAYGGTIYLTSGSHGCINTPSAQAAAIYEEIEVGTPVICYSSGIDYGYAEQREGLVPDTGTALEDLFGEGDADIIIIDGAGSGETDSGTDSLSGSGEDSESADFDIVISDETIWPEGASGPDSSGADSGSWNTDSETIIIE